MSLYLILKFVHVLLAIIVFLMVTKPTL